MSQRIDGNTLDDGTLLRTQVLVIGSGPAGSAVAHRLALAGIDTIVVEEGPIAPKSFEPHAFGAMSGLYRGLGGTVTRGTTPLPYLQGRVVGGTSVINGAISWRLPQDVFDGWKEADPGLGLAWSEVSRELDGVETMLGVASTDPKNAGPNNTLMARGADALDLAHRPIRRNVVGCRGAGHCLEGCPNGAKRSVDVTYLEEAVSLGVRLVYNCEFTRLDSATRGSGRARHGNHVTFAFEHVVLAASAVQTPVILLNSGIKSGPVGRGFQAHPGVSVMGRFSEPVEVWKGATQGHEVTGLRKEGIKFEALGFDRTIAAMRQKSVGLELAEDIRRMDHTAHWGAAIRAQAQGVVRSFRKRPQVCYSLESADAKNLRRGVAVLGRMMLAAGAESVLLGVHGEPEELSSLAAVDRFETSGTLKLQNYSPVVTHMFGTCRMGSDRRSSVVNPDFRHHKIASLSIADSSVFPSNTGVNPQTSIIALASMCGTRVASLF